MAWHVWKKFGRPIYWHNGGTAGYRSFLGFDPKQKTGVIVLCNTFHDIDDIGLHWLDPKFRAKLDTPKVHTEIPVDPPTLERYVGEYQLAPTFKITMTHEENHLYAQATGQARLEIYAEKPNEFFLKVVDAQIAFTEEQAVKSRS